MATAVEADDGGGRSSRTTVAAVEVDGGEQILRRRGSEVNSEQIQ